MDYLRLMIQRIQNKYSIDRKMIPTGPRKTLIWVSNSSEGLLGGQGVKGTYGESPLLYPAALRWSGWLNEMGLSTNKIINLSHA